MTQRLDKYHPDISHLLKQIGQDVAQESARLLTKFKAADAWALVGPANDGARTAALWSAHLREKSGTAVLEGLLFEEHVSASPGPVSQALPWGYRYFKTLHVVRQRVALALYDQAREVNWRSPVIFIRALTIARCYLRLLVEHEDLSNEGHRGGFSGRLGVATVLISRFSDVAAGDLLEAQASLKKSLLQSNAGPSALPYLLEAAIRAYDLSGDSIDLKRALDEDAVYGAGLIRSTGWLHAEAEAWLRLMDAEGFSAAFCQKQATQALDHCVLPQGSDAQDEVRHLMLRALSAEAARLPVGEPLGLRGVRLPFSLQHYGLATAPVVDAIAASVIKAMTCESRRGEPLRRSLIADYKSLQARRDVASAASVELLCDSVAARNGTSDQSPLLDQRSRYALGQDLLLLASITGNDEFRCRGLNALLLEAADHDSAAPLVLLARDVELHGPFLSQDSMLSLPAAQPLAEAIQSGSHVALYEAAARRALEGHDLSRRGLGGRGNVVTTGDYFGITDETFVIKATTKVNHERDLRRTRHLEDFLASQGLSHRFGLVEHVTAVLPRSKTLSVQSQNEVLTVRKFSRGKTLAAELLDRPSDGQHLLIGAAEFLAVIHHAELATTPSEKARAQVRTKELGRWLRDGIQVPNWSELFERWWGVAGRSGLLPRRDSHPDNWIVEDSGRLLALDLEATGCRPFGYELAQLTDDHPILDPSDRHGRRAIFDRYVDVLFTQSVAENRPALWTAYCYGLFARAVRTITDPHASNELCHHGQQLLQTLPSWEPSLSDLCATTLTAWELRAGLSPSDYHLTLAEGRRRRISRTLSFSLRHDTATPLNQAGWIEALRLSEHLREQGLTITVAEILSVAGAINEPRFEVTGTKLRARYGHSLGVEMDYVGKERKGFLFHATEVGNLEGIINRNEGLLPMSRQWVHLSDDPAAALQTGRRHGRPVLLAVDAEALEELVFAAGGTWLTRHVPVSALSIVTVAQHWSRTQETV